MKNTFAALALGLFSTVYAQVDYTAVYDGNAFLNEGIKLYDEGKYQDAIKRFDKIVKNDPQFYTAQYEKAISLAAGENKDAAKAFYEDAYTKGYMAEVPDFYMAYGNFLSDQKDFEKSEKIFLEGRKIYPNSSVLMYNLALLYLRKEERQKSIDLLENAITINPNHSGSHYLLGLIALEDGRAVEGSMALLGYLTLVQNTQANETAIVKLNEKFSENYLEKSKLIFSRAGGDNFEEIDVILRNSLPLKNAYKVNSTFDDIIIRQVQAIAEYCTEHKGNTGFFETTYVPWLADIVNKKQFEGFSYHILLGMKDKLGKKLTSQNKKIDAFSQYIANDFWNVFAKRKIDLFGKQEEVVIYLQNGKPYLIGKIINDKKEGKFKVLDKNGVMMSELNFANNELEGLQKYYDDKGRVTEEKNFSKGKADGKRTTYYDNGNLELVETYRNDMLNGTSISYYINGGKCCEGNFVDDERDGSLICLYENGTKKNEISYSKGKLNGRYVTYDKLGNVNSDQTYAMDKINGKSLQYYDGKILKSEIEYNAAGTVSSPFKSYYPDTKLKEEITYVNDIPKTESYNFANGKKSHVISYDKDSYVTTYYNGGENKYFEETYKQNLIKSAQQFEAGVAKPLEIPVSKGLYTMKNFDGAVLVKGKYTKGKKDGEWNYFYNTGALKIKENFKNGTQSGLEHTYNRDSRLARISNFVQDTLSGISENYDYGTLKSVYYYNKGELNGPSKILYPDGTISEESFYINGELYSKNISYWQNGNIRIITEYEEDTTVKMTTFTADGKKENEIDYTNKNGKIVTLFNNGNEVHEYSMTNGILDGKYTVKNKAGKMITDCTYTNGSRNGKYLKYGPTGALYNERNYYAGKPDGLHKYYDLAGNVRMNDNFVLGDNTGQFTRFYHNKAKFVEYTEFDDKIEGEAKYYNQKGENILILGYSNNDLLYYITLDKDGKLTQKTPVVAQTAKIVSVYPNNKTAIEINFMKGNLDGKIVVTSTDGKPEFDANYSMDLLSGIRTEYYPNGKVYKKENFKDGDFEGLQEFFKEDGKPWLTAEYKNDQMHGLCKVYTNGTLTQIQRYDSDELVEILK